MCFLQMFLMDFSMRQFHLQADCGDNYYVQQITMKICIAWIFHAPIHNLIKGAILIEHLCLKSNIFNSKIQIIHHNNYFNFFH